MMPYTYASHLPSYPLTQVLYTYNLCPWYAEMVSGGSPSSCDPTHEEHVPIRLIYVTHIVVGL